MGTVQNIRVYIPGANTVRLNDKSCLLEGKRNRKKHVLLVKVFNLLTMYKVVSI